MTLFASGCPDDTTDEDSGPPTDAGPDGEIACTTDVDCSDGLFCNGEETCAEGSCVAAASVACEDSIECTIDVCNEVTDRCESMAPDLDEDGIGDANCLDEAGEPLGRDCDDTNPARFGGNREVCDAEGLDEDCDPETFGNLDNDGDGYFDDRCFNTDDAGVRHGGDDCNDGRGDVNPATAEVCDRRDNNCDGEIDEGVRVLVAPDGDRDGFPSDSGSSMQCPGFAGLIAIDDDTLFDCDDANPARNPGQVEICDLADNDCDPNIDEDARSVDWFRDLDGDGFGSRASGVTVSCEPVSGSSLLSTDCNDDAAGINPASAEMCNGIDDDCNGRADFEISDGDFEDDDDDGVADIACGLPRGLDCDDEDAATAGGGTESCDGRDNDCDDRIDEGATEVIWYYDGDRDGHGTSSNPSNPPVSSCTAPRGYVGSGGDCNDMDRNRSPDATETCNRVDDDCDGALDESPAVCACPGNLADCDGDGFCETDLATDAENCGACNDVMPSANCLMAPNVADAICASGRCLIFGCADAAGVPTNDCDENPANGCERLDTDVNCGECGRACDCQPDLTCLCVAGERFCNSSGGPPACVPINTAENCGGCGNRCDGGTCSPDAMGGFFCECGPTSIFCGGPDGGTCVENGPSNCGACGNFCQPGQFCDNNRTPGDANDDSCRCTTGELCPSPGGPACTDVSMDGANCGFCGNVCGAGQSCTGGSCECPGGELRCSDPGGSYCVPDPSIDNANCGFCGNMCPVGSSCTGGVCQCAPGDLLCAGPGGPSCTDPSLDNSNCGSCGKTCPMGTNCGGGICECGIPGETVCGAGCADLDSDPNNCGGCGISCGVGGACNLGVCDPILTVGQGASHSCALRGSGAVVCWGNNANGQSDPGAPGGNVIVPQVVPFLPPALSLSVGQNHSCAIVDQSGTPTVWCWGDTSNGRLGHGAGTIGGVTLAFGAIPTSVSAGSIHTCATTSAGNVQCWGGNGRLQTGSPHAVPDEYTSPQEVVSYFGAVSIHAGGDFTCAAQSGFPGVDCWGANDQQQLNQSPFTEQMNPSDVMLAFSGIGAAHVSVGNQHACALSEGELRCWGQNASGEVDFPAMPADAFAATAAIPGNPSIAQVVTRLNSTCALTAGGSVWCTGRNQNQSLVPGNLSTSIGWTRITILGSSIDQLGEGGSDHGCVISRAGAVFCWGRQANGKLGNETTAVADGIGPIRVRALTP